MSELVNFFKELFLLKKYDDAMVGLSGFRHPVENIIVKKTVRKKPASVKEVKLSDLMRRA